MIRDQMGPAARAGNQSLRLTQEGARFCDRLAQGATAIAQLRHRLLQRWTEMAQCSIMSDKGNLADFFSLRAMHIDPPMSGHSLAISHELCRHEICVLLRGIVVRQFNARVIPVASAAVSQIEEVACHCAERGVAALSILWHYKLFGPLASND